MPQHPFNQATFAKLNFWCTEVTEVPSHPAPPNIVFVLFDDVGWADFGYNSPGQSSIPTPNIDRMAKQGWDWLLLIIKHFPGLWNHRSMAIDQQYAFNPGPGLEIQGTYSIGHTRKKFKS